MEMNFEMLRSVEEVVSAVEGDLRALASELHDLHVRTNQSLLALERIRCALERVVPDGASKNAVAPFGVLSSINMPKRTSRLSAQGARILSLIGSGMSNKEIGERLVVKEKTIRNYVSSILARLEVKNRTEAAAIYLAGHFTNGTHGKPLA